MSNPTGNVQINKNGFSIGSAPVDPSTGAYSLTYTTDGSDVPSDALVASYQPDASHNPSSASFSVEVDSAVQDTVTTVSANSPVIVGGQVNITGTVKNA